MDRRREEQVNIERSAPVPSANAEAGTRRPGRPRKEPKFKTSFYTSYELRQRLEDLQHIRRKSSINDLINDILQEYVDNNRF